MAEEASKPRSPLEEIQRSFFEFVQETIHLREELKKSQERISELEKQLEAANETIAKQHGQLLDAADIIKEVKPFEKKATETIAKLRKQLAEKEREELAPPPPEVVTLNESEQEEGSNSECGNKSAGIIFVAKPNQATGDNNGLTVNNQNKTELQIIVSNLHGNVNELDTQENIRKRQKCLNKIIDQTANLVGCLSGMIGENMKNKSGSHSVDKKSLPSQPINLEMEVIDLEAEYETPQSSIPLIASTVLKRKHNCRISRTMGHGVDSRKPLFCICGHKSSTQSALVKHIRIRRHGNPFGCDMCSHRARDTTDLNIHYKRVHQENRSYANGCSNCGKIFSTRQDLLRHKYKDQCNNLSRLND